jgi:hypothetical protein
LLQSGFLDFPQLPDIGFPAMGFTYRKSIKLGPFRVNLSKRGVGASVGGTGFRTGVSGTGRKYTNFSLPGTGLGYRTSGGKGCLLLLFPLLLAPAVPWLLRLFSS